MKTLIFLNADARSDDQRFKLVDQLTKAQQQIELWFYSAEFELNKFHHPLDTAWERAQIWVHVSAFEDEEILLSWIKGIHPSWLQNSHLVFYSGGGLKDWQASDLSHWLDEQQLSHEVFKPSFPSHKAGSGYLQLLQCLQWLNTGFDPRQRTKQATNLLMDLTEGESASNLQPQFDALKQLYPPDQQSGLQTSWQDYLNNRLSIQAFKDVLFAVEC